MAKDDQPYAVPRLVRRVWNPLRIYCALYLATVERSHWPGVQNAFTIPGHWRQAPVRIQSDHLAQWCPRGAYTDVFTGRQKLAFARRLGNNWQDLADYFDIPADQRYSFASGREPQGVWEWLEARQRLPELLEALTYIERADIVVEVLAPPATSASAPRGTWQGSPFPGLRHFTPDDAAVFFGRSQETAELLTRLQQERFIAVVGASGSGKSSLVAAGVLPRLHEIPGGQYWQWVRLTPGDPGDDPFVALAVKLAPSLEQHGLTGRDIASKLRASGDLAALAELFLAGRPAEAELLLFIDQFEELFTLTAPEHHRRFIAMLARVARSPRLRTVLTLRADFYHRCVDYPSLAALLRAGTFPLAAPDLPALLEMITGPAAVAGLTFQDSLPSSILHDTGSDPGALALLAFALAELYAACQPGTTLTRAAYDSFGGVQGAIAKRADTTYGALEEVAQGAFGEVFKELVEVDPERGIPTRKRAPLAHFARTPAARQLIDRFAAKEARLLVCDDPVRSDAMVEVAHEALLTSWGQLHAWILERFDDLRLLRQVQREAEEWERHGYPEGHLWRHERLQPVYAMCQRLQPTLSATVQAFIRSEAERLLEELDKPTTSHQRRASIGDRLADISDPRPGVGLNSDGLPEFVWLPVPGGEMTLEYNAGTFTVQPFTISKYPVTWAQYRSFLEAQDGYCQRRWWRGLAERQARPSEQYRQQENHPAETVSWYDAVAFYRWLSARLGYEVRLPTEWEWQQAATGGDPSRQYPWGVDEDPAYANTWESHLGRTTAVGVYPQGASPVGALDMSGNVWEWCLNEYDRPQHTGLSGTARRVVRGGSCGNVQLFNAQFLARTLSRSSSVPVNRAYDLGLRVVRSSPSLA
jgi:formylglycine-generating enzyme required for sulfatase activity